MKDGQTRKSQPKKALGRGLAALLGDDNEPAVSGSPPTDPKPGEKVIQVPLERLEANPFQPRKEYDQKALKVLSDSIAQHGVLQPVVVRPSAGGYQLIAGERRMRASQMAGLTSVPAVVRRATDEQALVLALLENLQREDLNPLEEAKAYQRLANEFSLSQEDIARGVGKERPTVANSLRLLKLPQEIQEDISRGVLSAGHARGHSHAARRSSHAESPRPDSPAKAFGARRRKTGQDAHRPGKAQARAGQGGNLHLQPGRGPHQKAGHQGGDKAQGQKGQHNPAVLF